MKLELNGIGSERPAAWPTILARPAKRTGTASTSIRTTSCPIWSRSLGVSPERLKEVVA
jgi:hypothetical protein